MPKSPCLNLRDIAAVCVALLCSSSALAGDYQNSPQATALISEMTQDYGFADEQLNAVFADAVRKQAILDAISRPAEKTRQWKDYRPIFVTDARISKGVSFWQEHAETLARAENEYGVPAQIIVAIIGVETSYGGNTGSWRVIDALSTLCFDYPPRATFFCQQLKEYLLLARQEQVDPLTVTGSYAGAMGLPQFMPSSWAKYAVDFDGDGRVDLFHSPADVIGSVANYFKAFQWRVGMPTHYPVRLTAEGPNKAALLAPDILPTFSAATMVAKGAELDLSALQHEGPLALVELQDGDRPPLYLAGTENFYAITRYNWSSYYALAVIELGQAVAAAMPK